MTYSVVEEGVVGFSVEVSFSGTVEVLEKVTTEVMVEVLLKSKSCPKAFPKNTKSISYDYSYGFRNELIQAHVMSDKSRMLVTNS